MSLREPCSGPLHPAPKARIAGAPGKVLPAAWRIRRAALAGLLATAVAFPLAGRAGDHDERRDHDQARQALLEGKVVPLRTVLEKIEHDYPGEPVKIEFEHDNDTYIYEIKLLQAQGTIVKLKVDAATGTVLSAKSREGKHEKDD
jgi:uncharacterized membrane protein YkoI